MLLRYRVSLSGKPITTQVGCARCCSFVYITAIPRVMVVQSLFTSESAPFHACKVSLNHLSTAPHAVIALKHPGRRVSTKKVTRNRSSQSSKLVPQQRHDLLVLLFPLTLQSPDRWYRYSTTRRVTQDPDVMMMAFPNSLDFWTTPESLVSHTYAPFVTRVYLKHPFTGPSVIRSK